MAFKILVLFCEGYGEETVFAAGVRFVEDDIGVVICLREQSVLGEFLKVDGDKDGGDEVLDGRT